MIFFLIFISTVLLLGVILSKLSNHIGIPVLLGFIVLGMLFGSDGIFRIDFENYDFANQIATISLLFIIFYGGFGTCWKAAKPVAVQSIMLSTLGVVITAALTGVFCHYALNFDWLESFLIGSVISSTDAASVFSILRSKNLNLKYNTASMLELESGSNDPCAYMLTYILLAIMGSGITAGGAAILTVKQIIFGIAGGVIIASAGKWIIKKLDTDTSVGALFIIAIALLSYALPTVFDGNGYLSAYIVGVVLGNQKIPGKKEMVHFMDGVVSLMQIALFFLLGLLAFPSRLPAVLPAALAIMAFITFVSRPIATFMMLTPFRAPLRQQGVVAWSGLRGATSIVFAIMVVISSVSTENDLFDIAFCIVLLSIAIQGTLLPWISKKLKMIDEHGTVLKTFNDYSDDDTPIQFIRIHVVEKHPWNQKKIKEVPLTPDMRAALILRGNERILPKGNTVLKSGDTLILSALAYQDEKNIELFETAVDGHEEWINKKITEIDWEGNLVILITRAGKTILPNGNVKLKAGDVIVLADMH